ncbi:MAG TPA: hypothetical protein VEL11_02400 [Candidatus Bathyarchaeia archaeon]|nr:hypothetical protein [Candidatus Bathyarchaeia archaeon]
MKIVITAMLSNYKSSTIIELAMHVEQSLLPRVICSRPPGFQFFRMICVLQQKKMDNKTPGRIGMVTLFDTTEGLNRRESWRPYVVLVKGQRDTQPLIGPNILEVIYTAGDVIDLATALVRTLSPLNGSICDPFMGEGVVGDATIKFGQGRKYTGIERDIGLFLYARDILGNKLMHSNGDFTNESTSGVASASA